MKIKFLLCFGVIILAVGCGVKGLPLPPDDPAPIFNRNFSKPEPSPTPKSNVETNIEKK